MNIDYSKIKLYLMVSIAIVTSVIYGFYTMPFAWRLFTESQNYAAGRFGEFLLGAPFLLFGFLLYVGITLIDSKAMRK